MRCFCVLIFFFFFLFFIISYSNGLSALVGMWTWAYFTTMAWTCFIWKMGISKSRMKKVTPMSVTEETVCSSGIHRDESPLFGPSNTKASYLRVSIRRRAQADCEGQDSEFLAEEVDRILAQCDNTDTSLNRTSYKMSMFGSKSLGLYCYAKGQDCSNAYSGSTSDKNEVNTVNTPTSIHEKVGLLFICKVFPLNAMASSVSIQPMTMATRINTKLLIELLKPLSKEYLSISWLSEQARPPQDLLNIESTATAS